MGRMITLTVSCLLLAACAGVTYTWKHPENLGAEKLDEDQQYCDQLANNERGGFYNHFPHFYERHQYHYRHFPHFNDHVGYYEEYRSLFRVCMKARGWEYVKEEKAVAS
ncbi:hypothetical protein [Motiliproteus sp. MSK22-1]|uniref:hypothetical protein n=1 Tax=Motiliproteus sp. MSK22-1 TaxID=1897630 RepID=UPI0009782ED3|nr:hypothetical protein [Motiliproteus sp. MSK22-1]OMH26631.1 hypothetical protein BGP75_23325 [Motiliproteus sp. MSK22-1]